MEKEEEGRGRTKTTSPAISFFFLQFPGSHQTPNRQQRRSLTTIWKIQVSGWMDTIGIAASDGDAGEKPTNMAADLARFSLAAICRRPGDLWQIRVFFGMGVLDCGFFGSGTGCLTVVFPALAMGGGC